MNGTIFTTEAGTPSIVGGIRGENGVKFWAVSRNNSSSDDYCKSQGYNAALSTCKNDAEGVEGLIVSNTTSTVNGQMRWALGCSFGRGGGIVRVPTHVACVKFKDNTSCKGTGAPNTWISYSGNSAPNAACSAAGFPSALSTCKGTAINGSVTEGALVYDGAKALCQYGDQNFRAPTSILCAPKREHATLGWVSYEQHSFSGTATWSTPQFTGTQSVSVSNGLAGDASWSKDNLPASEICKKNGFLGATGVCKGAGQQGSLVQNKTWSLASMRTWGASCILNNSTGAVVTEIQCLK